MKRLIIFISFVFFVNVMKGQIFSDKIISIDSCQVINELLKLAILDNALLSSDYFSNAYNESYKIVEVPVIFSFDYKNECKLDDINGQYQFLLITENRLRELRKANKKTRFDLVIEISDFTVKRNIVEVTLTHNSYLTGISYVCVDFIKNNNQWYYKIVTARTLN